MSVIFQNTYDCRLDEIQSGPGICKQCCLACPLLTCFFFVYCIGSAFTIVLCEIVFFSPFAFFLWTICHERYTRRTTSIIAKRAFDFILDNKPLYTHPESIDWKNMVTMHRNRGISQLAGGIDGTSGSRFIESESKRFLANREIRNMMFSKEEQMFRLIFVNYCFLGLFSYRRREQPSALVKYLENEAEREWKCIKIKDLRNNTEINDYHRGTIIEEFKHKFEKITKECKHQLEDFVGNKNNFVNRYGSSWYCLYVCFRRMVVIYSYFILYVFLPLFLLSRLFSMLFPFISIINILYLNDDYNNIESVQLLQWILTVSYMILIVLWIISAIRCLYYYHWTSHVVPNGHYWDAVPFGAAKYFYVKQYCRLNLMQKFYNTRLNEKFLERKRKEIVIEILGKDIGGVIVSYWPKFELKPWLQQLKKQQEHLKYLM